MKRLLTITSLALMALTVGACGSDTTGGTSDAQVTNTQGDQEGHTAVTSGDLFGYMSNDYIVADNPSELAREADVAGTGTISGVIDGRTYSEDSLFGATTSKILVVQPEENVKADRDLPAEIYIELENSSDYGVAEFESVFTEGSRVAFYLTRISEDDGVEPIKNRVEKEQSDGNLYIPSGPQSLILELSDDEVEAPFLRVRSSGTIEDYGPTGTKVVT